MAAERDTKGIVGQWNREIEADDRRHAAPADRGPWRRVVCIESATPFWIRTGRPALRARATVIGSIFVYDFEPKPPPR